MRALVLATLVLFADAAGACTTFCNRGLFGRNYDWDIGYGALMVNKRGLAKTARGTSPAQWTSKYGSLTFNQYGRENPTGGMNERGLVVELMWLSGTTYPAPDERPQISELEWVQYQLDTAATVAEVVASLDKVRIARDSVPLHFLVADRNDDVASIEFLNGKAVVHRGKDLPHRALANDPYARSLDAMKRGANDRFARAAKGLANATTVSAAFALLDNVADPHRTQWSIVYDQKKLVVHYRTLANRKLRSVRMNALQFDCGTTVKMLDVDHGSGDVTLQMKPYASDANAKLVRRSVRGTPFLREMTEQQIEEAARWPERAACAR